MVWGKAWAVVVPQVLPELKAFDQFMRPGPGNYITALGTPEEQEAKWRGLVKVLCLRSYAEGWFATQRVSTYVHVDPR